MRTWPGAEGPDISRRREDWRCGSVVYQVFVDRFATSASLAAKQEHYRHPRRLRSWTEAPSRGGYLADERVFEGELEFWGGDLRSLAGRLDHLAELEVAVLYLNPIFEAFSNHKYDTGDYFRIDPQYGTMDDLRHLVEKAHEVGMRVLLDGVFNHVGRRSGLFTAARDGGPADRAFFDFDEGHPHGYRSWRDVANLPELDIEEPRVRRYLWEEAHSVVQFYLRDVGIDGWRLDVEGLLAFLRTTDRARETLVTLVNPTPRKVRAVAPLRDSRLMDAAPLGCLLTGHQVTVHCGLIEVTLPPYSARINRPADRGDRPGYSMFKRV